MATLVEYEAAVDLRGFDGVSTTRKDAAINEARRRLVRDHRWSWLESVNVALSTTANDDEVAIAGITNLAHVDAVRFTADGVEREMEYLSYQELRHKQAVTPSTGVPLYWSKRGSSTLLLYPTPEAAYTLSIDHVVQPADLTTGSDPLIPDDLQDLVAWAAVPPLAFRQREAWAVDYAERQYSTLLRAAVSADNVRQRQSGRQVRSGYWGRR